MRLTKTDLEMAIDALDSKRTEYYRLYEIAFDRDIADIVQRKIDDGKMLSEALSVELERASRRRSGEVRMRLNEHQIDMMISAMKARIRKYYRVLDDAQGDIEQVRVIQGYIYRTNVLTTRLLDESDRMRRRRGG